MTGVDFATDVSPAASAIILMLAASPIAPSDAAERLKGKGIEVFFDPRRQFSTRNYRER